MADTSGTGAQGVVGKHISGTQFINDDRLHLSVDEEIARLNIDKTKLLHLMNRMKRKVGITQMKHHWWTKERKSDFVALKATDPSGGAWGSGADSSGTLEILNTTDAHLFAEGDVFILPSFDLTQQFWVSSVTGKVITAQTVDGADVDFSAGTDPNNGDNILRVSTSFEEGGDKGTIKSESPDQWYNMVQIFQNPVGVTTTAQHIAYRGESEWDQHLFDTGVDHAFDIEKALFLGQRAENNTGFQDARHAQHFMGGAQQYISSNLVADGDGNLTQTEFTDWMIDATEYADEPMVFCGSIIFEGLTKWSETNLEVQRTEDTLGMAVSKFVTPYGDTILLVPHRELLRSDLAGVAFSLDMADIEYLYLEGLDTHMTGEIQDNGAKQRIEEYRTWASFKMGNEKKHGLYTGVTAIST